MVFVVSLGFPNGNARRVLLGKRFEVWNWIPDRKTILSACDVVVSRPGHSTILEALWFRKPLILVLTPGHTEKICNARTAANLGIAKIISQKELNRNSFIRVIRDILSSNIDFRKIEAKNFKQSLKGLEHMVKEIYSMVIN